jgi:hypothetical protein
VGVSGSIQGRATKISELGQFAVAPNFMEGNSVKNVIDIKK